MVVDEFSFNTEHFLICPEHFNFSYDFVNFAQLRRCRNKICFSAAAGKLRLPTGGSSLPPLIIITGLKGSKIYSFIQYHLFSDLLFNQKRTLTLYKINFKIRIQSSKIQTRLSDCEREREMRGPAPGCRQGDYLVGVCGEV